MKTIKSIPSEFIDNYIKILVDLAKTYPEDSILRAAILRRVECVMDMVDAYKKVL